LCNGVPQSVIIQGAAYHRMGSIMADAQGPKFAQLYTHAGDETDNIEIRIGFMKLSKLPTKHREAVTPVLKTIVARLKAVNPYVKDFIMIADLHRDQPTEFDYGKYIINPDVAPTDAGPRRCNHNVMTRITL
jgi:hypothetical protein